MVEGGSGQVSQHRATQLDRQERRGTRTEAVVGAVAWGLPEPGGKAPLGSGERENRVRAGRPFGALGDRDEPA